MAHSNNDPGPQRHAGHSVEGQEDGGVAAAQVC